MDLHRPEVLTSGGDLFKIFRTGSVKKTLKVDCLEEQISLGFPEFLVQLSWDVTFRNIPTTSKMWMAKIHAATPMYRHIKIALQGSCVTSFELVH